MSEMIKRVALAIAKEMAAYKDSPTAEVHDLQLLARRAIEAMREPTAAMVEKGAEFTKDDFGCPEDFQGYAKDCWQDMIDAALKQQGTPDLIINERGEITNIILTNHGPR